LAAVAAPSARGSNMLPSSLAAILLGSTYYVEVWVQDLLAPGVGIGGGTVDVGYTTAVVDAVSVVNQDYSQTPSGTIDDPNGVVQDLGGTTLTSGLGIAPQWARLGYVQVLATALGEATFDLSAGALQFGRFGVGSVDWSLVDLGSAIAVEQIGGTRIDMTTVKTPSATAGNGEVADLPASAAWVHEWEQFWVEIWVSTPDTTTLAISRAAVDLQYDTAYLTALEIQYGPAFTQNQTGTIDDALGLVDQLGGATTLTDVGDDAYVLLARVRFASTGSDQVPVDEAGRNIGPYDMQLALADGQTELVGAGAAVPELGSAPATDPWAVMHDIDDNNSAEAVEPLGQAQWRREYSPSSFILHPGSPSWLRWTKAVKGKVTRWAIPPR
jgi:alkaline phosphatase